MGPRMPMLVTVRPVSRTPHPLLFGLAGMAASCMAGVSDPNTDNCICCDTPNYWAELARCDDLPSAGPWGASVDDWEGAPQPVSPLFGAETSRVPPTVDAGLAAVIAAMPRDLSVDGSWAVTDAVVVNLGSVPSRSVWLNDAHEAVRLNTQVDLDPVPRPGDTVRFTATRLSNAQGDLQVTALTSWSVGPNRVPVPVYPIRQSGLTAADRGRNMEVYGATRATLFADDFPGHCGGAVFMSVNFAEFEVVGDSLSEDVCEKLIAPVVLRVVGSDRCFALDLSNPAWVHAYPRDDVERGYNCE